MTTDSLNQAIELIRQGKTFSAQPILRALVADEPNNIMAWFWYVETIPSYDERARVLRKCLDQNPDNQKVKDALDYLTSIQSKAISPQDRNINELEKDITWSMIIKNRVTRLSNYFENKPVLLIWAIIVAIITIIYDLFPWGSLPPTISTWLPSIFIILHFTFANPFVVGFIFTFIHSKESNATVMNGARRGAFAALIIVGTEVAMLALRDRSFVWLFLSSLLKAPIEGAIAGVGAVLWKNKNSGQKNHIVGDSNFKGIKITQNEKPTENGSLKADWVDTLFYVSYVFIVLGAAATVGLVLYFGDGQIFTIPFFQLLVVAPAAQALIICIIIGKMYRNILSGVANLLASLVVSIGSAWVMLSVLPLKSGSYGLLPLFAMLIVSGGHFFTLTITMGVGRIIKSLKRNSPSVR